MEMVSIKSHVAVKTIHKINILWYQQRILFLLWYLFCSTGKINMEEFIKGAQQDPWLLNMFKLDMNPAGWVLEQRRRSAHFWNVKAQQFSKCLKLFCKRIYTKTESCAKIKTDLAII